LKTVVKKLYEAMFLVDSAEAAADWDASLATIKKILERAKAKIVSIRKWDECKLAYEINGKTRGTYILCYFKADGKKIRDIERDVQLSERIMRVLILSAEAREKEDIEKDTPAEQAEKYKQKAAQAAAERAEAKQVSAQRAEEAKEPEPARLRLAPPRRAAVDASESEQPETKDFEPADEQREQKADRRQRTEDGEQRTEKSDI